MVAWKMEVINPPPARRRGHGEPAKGKKPTQPLPKTCTTTRHPHPGSHPATKSAQGEGRIDTPLRPEASGPVGFASPSSMVFFHAFIHPLQYAIPAYGVLSPRCHPLLPMVFHFFVWPEVGGPLLPFTTHL